MTESNTETSGSQKVIIKTELIEKQEETLKDTEECKTKEGSSKTEENVVEQIHDKNESNIKINEEIIDSEDIVEEQCENKEGHKVKIDKEQTAKEILTEEFKPSREESDGKSDESVPPEDPKADSSGDDEKEGDNNESEEEKGLDDDEIKTNPAYIPKGGKFYMHDMRSGEGEEGQNGQIERKSRADGLWSHDLYVERRQAPKSTYELKYSYGYDIRSNEEGPLKKPRGERRPFGGKGRQRTSNGTHNQKEKNHTPQKSSSPSQQQTQKPRTFKRTVYPSNHHNNKSNQEEGTKKLEKDFNNLSTKTSSKKGPRPENYERSQRNRPAPSYNANPRPSYNPHENQQIQTLIPPHAQTISGPIPVSLVGTGMMQPPVTFVPIGVAQAPPVPVMAAPLAPHFMRQPTDTVYFDVNAQAQQQPALPPRERRRLKFVAPTK